MTGIRLWLALAVRIGLEVTETKAKVPKTPKHVPILKAYVWVRVQILFNKGLKGKGYCVKGCCMTIRGDLTLDLEPYVLY